jgi:hypothetical protein
MIRLKKFLSALTLAGLILGASAIEASAHTCMKHPRHDSFHDRGRHKGDRAALTAGADGAVGTRTQETNPRERGRMDVPGRVRRLPDEVMACLGRMCTAVGASARALELPMYRTTWR